MLDHLKEYQIILASKSPRRRKLLQEILPEFETTSVDLEEDFPDTMKAKDVAVYLAEKKADAFAALHHYENPLLITADTIVCLEGHILGKPLDDKEAAEMLGFLSGKVHEVISGVCLKSKNRKVSFSSCTRVHFKELSREEIDYYVQHYKPFDKAGSYGIQEWIGYIGIDRIEGSFYNVMGLPMQALYHELRKF